MILVTLLFAARRSARLVQPVKLSTSLMPLVVVLSINSMDSKHTRYSFGQLVTLAATRLVACHISRYWRFGQPCVSMFVIGLYARHRLLTVFEKPRTARIFCCGKSFKKFVSPESL